MIYNNQESILGFVNRRLKKIKKANDMISYFAVFEKTPGYYLIRSHLNKIYFFNFFISIFKHFIDIFNSKVSFKNTIRNNKNYNQIIVSWAFSNNFDKTGVYQDKYLKKKSSDDTNIVWLLIYLDKNLPDKISDNIILVYRDKSIFKKCLFFFCYIFQCLKREYLTLSFFKKLNSFSSLSLQGLKIMNQKIDCTLLSKVLIVYEGQPFQKDLIEYFKKKKESINVQGYDHSAPPPLPLHLIYDQSSPDELLITGTSQKKFYSEKLRWPPEKLKIIKTLRFNSETKDFYLNKIFLPYELRSLKVYLSSIKNLIETSQINLKSLKIKNHPLQSKSKIHLKLINDIKSIIEFSDLKNKEIQNSSIFFDQTTAVIVALDLGVTCYHICSDPIFDSYTSELWENIKVEKVNNNLFKYSLNKTNTFLS